MSACFDCPRRCGAEREERAAGACRSPRLPRAARAAAHYGEEPCISGTRGSGAIFFTGCSLGCAYCQNAAISGGEGGFELTVEGLRGVMLRLRDSGVHNINLVTGTHFVRPIAEALDGLELGIPVAWNSSGYESVESLRRLEGLVQIYMPDYKYSSSVPAARYSAAPDYPEVASAAILEMFRQTGPFRLDDDDMLTSGVLIRHLMLPRMERETRQILRTIQKRYGNQVWFSLMSQYTPTPAVADHPVLCRPVEPAVYQSTVRYALSIGLEQGFVQEEGAVSESFIPDFSTGEGILHSISLPDSHCFSFQQE